MHFCFWGLKINLNTASKWLKFSKFYVHFYIIPTRQTAKRVTLHGSRDLKHSVLKTPPPQLIINKYLTEKKAWLLARD